MHTLSHNYKDRHVFNNQCVLYLCLSLYEGVYLHDRVVGGDVDGEQVEVPAGEDHREQNLRLTGDSCQHVNMFKRQAQ